MPRKSAPLYLRTVQDTRTEAERMDAGCALLARCGYDVLRIGQSRQAAICHKCTRENRGKFVRIKCKTCGSDGFSPSTQSTAGTPDTMVSRDCWPWGTWLGIEWKAGPKGERTKEQKELEARGRIVVVWDDQSVADAVCRYERDVIGIAPAPMLAGWIKSGPAATPKEQVAA